MADYFYESNTCSSLDDFFYKLSAFCVSSSIDVTYRFTAGASNGTAGTSVNASGDASGTTYAYKRFSVYRGSDYFLARYHTTGGVYVMPSPNDAAAVWNSTTGKPDTDFNIFPIPASGTYYFHQYKYTIHAVCKLSSGVHVHLCFGNLAKVGSWTGGAFFTGTYSNTSSTAYTDGNPVTGQHCFLFQNGATLRNGNKVPKISCTYNGLNYGVIDYHNTLSMLSGYNKVNSSFTMSGSLTVMYGSVNNPYTVSESSPNSYAPYRVAAFPIELQLFKNADDSLFYDLGTVEGVRFINIKNLESGDIVNDDWVAYPLSIKGSTGSLNNYAATMDFGIAVYKGP
jgi:hypothetical protein